MKRVISHFKQYDPILAPIVVSAFSHASPICLLPPVKPSQYFEDLVETIISQQLSVKAADTIYGRFKTLLGGKVTPSNVLGQDVESLRAVGLSRPKAGYLLAMAEDIKTGRVRLNKIHTLEDEAIITEITKIKGLGRWSAEMFLMFSLGRPDVFSYLDLGLIRAFETAYNVQSPTPETMEPIVAKWSPYRTYAALALWHSRDNQPPQ